MNNSVVVWHDRMSTTEAITRLAELVPLLANPLTHRTIEEVAVRISDVGWNRCEQLVVGLMHDLDPLVVQLILRAVAYAADHLAVEHGDNILKEMVQLLRHNSADVQGEAIVAIRSTHFGNEEVIDQLRNLLMSGPPSLRTEVIGTLVEIDPSHRFANEVAELFKDAQQA